MKAGGAPVFTPSSVVSAPLFLWHRSDLYTTGATDTWDDKSGNGRTATQGTGTAKPATGGAAINGFATIDFDPSATIRHLDYASNTFTALTAAEVFIVRKCNSDSATTVPWTMGSSGSASFAPFADRGLYDDFGSTTRQAAGAPAANAWLNAHCLNIIATGTEWTANFNFGLLFTQASNAVGWASTTSKIGADAASGTGFAGQIAEIIVYGGKLSAADRDALANSPTSYIRSRYGL